MIFPRIDLEDRLFLSASGKIVPQFQNYPGNGSLLYQFGCVTGLEGFTFKMLRKGAEGVIQSSAGLAARTKELNSHNPRLGREVYDKMSGARRNVFLSNLGKQSQGCSKLRHDKEVGDAKMEQRRARDQVEKEQLLQKARSYLADLSKKEPWDERPTAINAEDVQFLKTIFTADLLGR